MRKELIKLASDLDKAGKPELANRVDSLLISLASDDKEAVGQQVVNKIREMAATDARVRLGKTTILIGDTAILFGYQGSEDGIPGNAGYTVAKSTSAVQSAIDALGLTDRVAIKSAEQDVITGYGTVVDYEPPESYRRPAAYQVDIIGLSIK